MNNSIARKIDMMDECNTKMDRQWAKVMKSSSLSLNMPSNLVSQETYLGPVETHELGHRENSFSKSNQQLHKVSRNKSCKVPN